jgi:hypothetical protein
MVLERWTNPKPLCTIVDRAAINFVPRGFGFVHHPIPYHQVPNPNLTIRHFSIAVRRRLFHTSACGRNVLTRRSTAASNPGGPDTSPAAAASSAPYSATRVASMAYTCRTERWGRGESLREGLARGDRKRPFEPGTHPKLSRRTCTCGYGLQSWREKPAGVAKRPRERSPTRNP